MTNEALKLAIEKGGYKELPKRYNERFEVYEFDNQAILLDPLFWQALGKALGWGGRNNEEYMNNIWPQEEWLYHWHGFIYWIAEGKPADSFFKKLIKHYDTTKTNA